MVLLSNAYHTNLYYISDHFRLPRYAAPDRLSSGTMKRIILCFAKCILCARFMSSPPDRIDGVPQVTLFAPSFILIQPYVFISYIDPSSRVGPADATFRNSLPSIQWSTRDLLHLQIPTFPSCQTEPRHVSAGCNDNPFVPIGGLAIDLSRASR